MEKVNIGVDIGGMSLKAGLVNKEGKILYKEVIKTDVNKGDKYFLECLHTLIANLIKYAKNNSLEVNGIGLGVPGIVNNDLKTIEYAPNLKIENLSLKDALKDFDIPFSLSNDANCAALAEQKFGIAKGYKNVILLTLGTGVGGGIVIDNNLFEGTSGQGAELGHMVIRLNGRKCGCGRKGCFEAYASASALLRLTKEEMKKNPHSLMWEYADFNLNNVNGLTSFECAKKGDLSANNVVNKYVYYLGEGILNFCNIFRPEVVVLGGGVSNQKEFLISKVKKYLEENHYGFKKTRSVDVLIASLGNDAGIIGAASLISVE